MSTFNQLAPTVPTLINSSSVLVTGNAASANALTVRQFGTGNVFSAQTTTGSTALFVGANGNVGIGTTNPQYPLDIAGQPRYSIQPVLQAVQLSIAPGAAAGWYRVAALDSNVRAKFRIYTIGGNLQEQVVVTTAWSAAFSGYPTLRIEDQSSATFAGTQPLYNGQVRTVVNVNSNGTWYLEVYLGTVATAYTLYVQLIEGDASGASITLTSPIVAGSIPTNYTAQPTVPVNAFSVTPFNTTSNVSFLITNTGNVGIGTASPGYLLDVGSYGVDGGTIRIASSSSCQFRMMEVNDTYGFSFTNVAASRMSIKRHSASQAGTEIISILRDNPYVGIGTTNPGYALDVQGPGSPVVTWTGYLWYNNSTGNPATSGTDYVAVNTNGAYRTTNGGFLRVSDVRIKKNIQPISNVFDAVLALKPCTFQYIDEAKLGSRIVQGFIAQEVEQVLPGVVNKTGTGYVPDIYTRGRVDGTTIILDSAPKNTRLEGLKIQVYYQNSSNVEASFEANVVSYSDKTITIDCESPSNEVFVYGTFTDRMYSVSNESMVPTLVAAIQELSAENTALKSQLQTIEARLAALEQSLATVTANVSSLEARA
jgi:hypothetical protein